MTKAQFIRTVSEAFDIQLKSAEALTAFVFAEAGRAVVRDGRFAWPGFGVWSLRSRKARQIRNPSTGELMQLGSTRTVGFRAAGELRGKIPKRKGRAR